MDRGERREIKERKWTSKLKKMYQGGWKSFLKVKTSGKKPEDYNEAESFRDLEGSKRGVKYKNTGTIKRDAKQISAKDQHKRDVKNKSLSIEEQQELDERDSLARDLRPYRPVEVCVEALVEDVSADAERVGYLRRAEWPGQVFVHVVEGLLIMPAGLVVLGAELANYCAGAPHLALAEGLELLLQTGAVVGLGVGVDGYLGLGALLDALVELLHHGLDGVVEAWIPVERAALGGGGAVGVHPVHALGCKQRHE